MASSGDPGTELVNPGDEIGKVTEDEHPTKSLRAHQRHLAAVLAGGGEDQIGVAMSSGV